MPLDFDESWYLANSSLTLSGLIPFRDFFGRSPLLLYAMGAVVRLTTNDIFFGRLVSVISSSLAAGMLYLITGRLFSKRVAITAGLLYALSPFPLRYGYLAVTEPMSQLLVLSSMLILVHGLDNRRNRFMFLSGVVLSMAVLVRRSSAIYAIGVPLLVLILHWPGIRDAERRSRAFLNGPVLSSITFLGGFSIAFAAALLLLITPSNTNMLLSMYDITELWRYAGMERTLLWNVKELAYQMPYLIVFSVICVSAWARRHLGDIRYNWFMALTCFMGIILLDIALPYESSEGLISRSLPGFISSAVYCLILVGVILLIFRPWTVLAECKDNGRRKSILLLPLSIPVGAAMIAPGADMTNVFFGALVNIYVLSLLFLLLLGLGNRMEGRPDRSTARVFRFSVSLLYIIYMAVVLLPVIDDPTFLVLLAATLVSAFLILGKVYFISRSLHLTNCLKKHFSQSRAYLFVLVIGILLSLSSSFLFRGWVEESSLENMLYGACMLIMTLLTSFIVGSKIISLRRIDALVNINDHSFSRQLQYLLPVFLVGIPFLFYFLRWWWMPIYFYEMTPGLIIFTSLALATSFSSKREPGIIDHMAKPPVRAGSSFCPAMRLITKQNRSYILCLLTLALFIPVFMYGVDPYNIYMSREDQHPSPDRIREISSYIEAVTEPDDEILAWPVYAFQSGRRIVMNITHPLVYGEFVGADEAGLANYGYPTVPELIDHMDTKDVGLIVVDVNIEEVFFARREYFREYIYARYNLVRDFGDVQILLRQGQ